MSRRRLNLPLHGVHAPGGSIRLPGTLRVPNFPFRGSMLFEWYVALDEDHYIYFQITCHWPHNPLSRLWTHFWYRFWGRPIRKVRFNGQDKSMVLFSTEFEHRHGRNDPTPLYRPDEYALAWRKLCNERARGEGTAPAEREQEPAVAGGSEDSTE